MSTFDAIVIGAGINGLVAAATLARQGKSVCILDQGPRPGGMASHCEDDGPPLAHLVHNLSPLALRELGAKSATVLSPPMPTVALDPEGGHVVVRDGQAAFADGSPHPSADAFGGLMAQMGRYGDLLRRLAEAAPPGGTGPLLSAPRRRELMRMARLGLGLKRLGKSDMRRFLQVLLTNAYDVILDEMPDGPLAGLLAADAVRGAAAGPRSPGTVFNLIYRMGHGGQVALPQTGMQALFDGLAAQAQAAGCTLRLDTRVTRILSENDAVTGVETEDGTHLTAPLVLTSSGPLQSAQLAGLAHFDIETTRRLRNIRARGTVAKVNLRLGSLPHIPNLPDDLRNARQIHAPSANYVEEAFNPSKYGEMSEAPVIEAVFVPGQTTGPVWLSALVQYAPADLRGGWTETARDRLLQITLETLGRAIPDLQGGVEASQVIPPDRIEAATGAPGGHWHHAELSLDQLLTIRPANGLGRYAMGPKGLYLCGASAHPGGDIMGLAGLNAARAALEGGS